MFYEPGNLIRLLEYGGMDQAKMYEAMAAALGLEFYAEAEGPVYTICSNAFVLDITSSACTLLLVDDARSGECALVQAYFNAYLLERPVFFFLLRFFVGCVNFEGTSPDDALSAADLQADLEVRKNICSCVFTGDFCMDRKLRHIPSGYNIFTHRFEHTLFSPLLSLSLGGDGVPAHCPDCRVSPNLYFYFTPGTLTIRTADALPRGPQYYYEGGGVRVQGRNVYIRGRRCQVASFVFGKGRTLQDALDTSDRLRDA